MTTRIVTVDQSGAVLVDITIHVPEPRVLPAPRPIIDTTGIEVRGEETRRVA